MCDCDSVEMMKENRISYFIMISTVILFGLFSRKIDFIPLLIGDVLYAVMIYFGVRFLLIYLNRIKAAMIALAICYCIELLQLYQAEWMVALRATTFGRYVLGQGFLWSDVAAYTFGTIIAYYLERAAIKKPRSRN